MLASSPALFYSSLYDPQQRFLYPKESAAVKYCSIFSVEQRSPKAPSLNSSPQIESVGTIFASLGAISTRFCERYSAAWSFDSAGKTRYARVQYSVCVFSSHPFWTSSSLDVPAGVTQEEGHTGFLIHLPSAVRALIFVARRIQPFLSLVDREVEFCVLTN